VPTITALREDRRGCVPADPHSSPWRVVPVEVAARSGLAEGRTLDRPALRVLRRELRRAEALSVAGGALRRRDLSRRRLAERLERAAIAPTQVAESLAVLARAGLVDDGRMACTRAAVLVERGYGDAAIRHKLDREGLDAAVVRAALDLQEPEEARAWRIIERRGTGPRTARYLAARGFAEAAVEAAAGADFAPDP
jgi:SOS response regulatory protein OraA/RecX